MTSVALHTPAEVEDSASQARPSLAIVGGGASGCLVAAQLLRLAEQPVRIVLVERQGGVLGRGVAYGTTWMSHLLNVPAGRMSAFEDDPNHFERWLARHEAGACLGALDFAPRILYGQYLRACLEQAEVEARPGVELVVLRDEAVRLENTAGRVIVHFRAASPLRVNGVVLALGNPPQSDTTQAQGALDGTGLWRGDPWAPGALEDIPLDGAVLLVGTGLTMIDVVLALDDGGHRGPVVALSRRGLVPQGHVRDSAVNPWRPSGGHPSHSARALLRQLRNRVDLGAEDWRPVVDGLRQFTSELWAGLPLRERHRFIRHLQPWWKVHRHRTAPEITKRLRALRRAGRVEVLAGRITAYRPSPSGVDVTWIPRGRRSARSLPDVAAVVNCTGPSFARASKSIPLVRDLLEQGLARLDPLGLGLDATAKGEILSAAGEASNQILTLGPPLKGVLWESIALPEIRVQARAVAERIFERVASKAPSVCR